VSFTEMTCSLNFFSKALKLKDHQSSFLMTAGHSEKEELKRFKLVTSSSEGYFLFAILIWHLLFFKMIIFAQFR